MQLIASEGRTWDASSKITASKCNDGGRNWLTVSGLIMKHGFSACATSPVSSSSLRTGMWRRRFSASRLMTPAAPIVVVGLRALHAATALPPARRISSASSSRNSLSIGSSWSALSCLRRLLSSSITTSAHRSRHARSTTCGTSRAATRADSQNAMTPPTFSSSSRSRVLQYSTHSSMSPVVRAK